MEKVTVVGAGSWGTALALVLADNDHEVRIWSHRKEQVEEINTKHTNSKYVPSIKLPETIIGFDDLSKSLEDVKTIVLAVPTKAIREVLQKISQVISTPLTIIHVSKGIEPDTLKRISEMIEDEMPSNLLKDVVVLSGPSHAEEVVLRHPTTVTVSSKNMKSAEYVQDLFINQHFRVYTNPDIIGVEIG